MFQQSLTEILSPLETARLQGLVEAFALIGGFDLSAWGIPRATQAIGFAMAIGLNNPHTLAKFLGGQFETGEPDDSLKGVLHASLQIGSLAIPIQLILFPSSRTEITFQNVEISSIMDHSVPVVSWPVLVILKLYAGGPQDKLDVQ